MRIIHTLVACLLPLVILSTLSSAADVKNVVLLAGPKSHGPENNGVHDYLRSVRLLKVALDNSNIGGKVKVKTVFGGWPKDQSVFEDADAIMVISDGRDGELFAEAPFLENDERVAFVQKQIQRGCGLLTFHFSTFAPDKYGAQVMDWTGGYFDWEENGKRQWYSAIKTMDEQVKLDSPNHPVSRGVKPFKMREEFYYNIRFAPTDKGLSPLLSVGALAGRAEMGNVVAWTKERPDGGRGFGTTCGHFYDNWKNDNFRKLVLNAIAWCAKVEVPETGVDGKFIEDPDVRLALANPDSAGRAMVDRRPLPILMFAGNEAHKWHNWEKSTPVIKALLEKDPRIKVEVSTDIEDLGKKKLSDYSTIILNNYCNWQDPRQLSDASKKAFLDYLNAGRGLVLIHFANGAFHFSLPKAGESDWPEYRKIARRMWNHQGGSMHDAFNKFTVDPTSLKHPITDGLGKFEITDELYYRQNGDEPIEPLITAHSRDTKKDEPLAFVYTYSQARVFQTFLGHSEKTYDAFETREMIRRAAAWTAVRPVRPFIAQEDPNPK